MTNRFLPLALIVAMVSGCMGGPPTRSVANDPAEMARRHAEVGARQAAMTQRSNAQQARLREAEARQRAGRAQSAPATGTGLSWQQERDHARAQCVLRATRAQLERGLCS